MGNECARFFRHLANKISNKSGQSYSDTVAFIRRRLRFDLYIYIYILKTCVISLRRFRGRISKKKDDQNLGTLDLNLTPKTEYH